MATATKICITPAHTGVFCTSGLSWASAQRVSEVLQDDMEKHHIYFNNLRFHDHLVHYMLSIWALGASPDTIQMHYERERRTQRPALPQDESVIRKLSDKAEFLKHMYYEENYHNFLAFFQREIETKGVPAVINEYIFSGDEVAESMLSRLYAGLGHPLIHLGFGIEFEQPAIIAQGLAETAVHADYLGRAFFIPAEEAAGGLGKSGSKKLVEIMDEMRADPKLRAAVRHDDNDKVRDGVFTRAPEEMVQHCSQWTVSEDQIPDKLVEMIDTVVYWTATAQNPHKQLKLDFFYIHAVNQSIFFKTLMDLSYLSNRDKARLLEMKGRMDLLIWASRNMPEPRIDDIVNYPIRLGWPELFAESCTHPCDDGHFSKFVRTIAHARELCGPYEAEAEQRGLRITGDTWLKIGNMAVDSVGVVYHKMWVRGAGFPEEWEAFGPRK